jgi:hypothetical protein
MSWIGLTGQGRAWTCPRRVGPDPAARHRPMPQGALLIETRISPEGRPQQLLDYRRSHPWPGTLSLQALPGGAIVLVLEQGGEVFHRVLERRNDSRVDLMRVTFSWDSAARCGWLTVEQPGTDAAVTTQTPLPPPLLVEDVYTLCHRPQLVQTDPDVIFHAISDRPEPVGPMPTLVGQVPVLTPDGYRPLSALNTGDLVRTARAGAVPVLARVTRRVPALGSFRPVRLRAPYFGLRRDLVVAPGQRLVIGGSEVEYIFGRQAVLVPAESLVNGFAAVFEEGHDLVRYHQLLLPGHEPLIAAGAEMETLYIGRLRRRPEALARSLLAQVAPELLPEQARDGLKVLAPFEAITLAEARAA